MKFTIATVVGLLLVHTSSALDSSPLNRNRIAILNQRSKGSSSSTPMYRIIKPISADSPPETFPVITHPFPPIYASKDAKTVVPTNSWFSNLFYPSVENLAPTTPDPYILRFLDDFDGTRGLSISQPDEKVLGSYPAQNNVPEVKAGYMINGVVVDFRVTAKEFENKLPNQTVTRWDLFSSDIQLASPDDPNKYIDFPLSRGMPFVTSKYNSLTPKFFTQHAIIKVEADKTESTDTYSGYKFKLSFNNNPQSTFIIYVLGDKPLTFVKKGLNNFVSNSEFTGVIQVGKLPKPEHEDLLDKSKGVWATGGKIDADISNDVVSSYTISWTKDGDTSKELLTYAYPHHLNSFVPGFVKNTDMVLQSSSKGPMKAVTGDVWKLQETQLNKVRWFPHQPAPEASTRNEIMETMAKDINSNYTEHTLKDDNYFSGKGLQKFALIALLLNKPEKTELRNPELAQRALDKIKQAISPYLDNTQMDPFVYDDLYKGIVSVNGLPIMMGGTGDVNAAFGHSYYNDHHYHQGYLIVAAAIIHYLDPAWRADELKSWTETLIRDVNTPVDDDPYFAQFRNWDWFAGHSWAGGIKMDGALDGRDQESVPESINFLWGTKLWGLATRNKDMTRLANLQLAVSKRTTYDYFWMLDGNKNRPAEMVKNKVAGIFFEQKVDYTTYFGRYLEFIHGIQQLPMTPMLVEYIRTPEFVTQEWDQKLKDVAPTVNSPWAGVLYSNLAIINPGDAYPKLRNVLMDDGQTRSYSLYLAATKPNFVRRALSKLTKPNPRSFKPMQRFESVNLIHPEYPQDKYP